MFADSNNLTNVLLSHENHNHNFFQLRHAIQGHLDAQASKKHMPVVEESDDDLSFDDPQNLQVVHLDMPDGYTLVSSRTDLDATEELERTTNV